MSTLNYQGQNQAIIKNSPQQYGQFYNPNEQAPNIDIYLQIQREKLENEFKCYNWLLIFFIICDLAFVTNIMIRLDGVNSKFVISLILNSFQLLVLFYALAAKNTLEIPMLIKADTVLNWSLYVIIFYYAFLIMGNIIDGGFEMIGILPLFILFVFHFIALFYFHRKNLEIKAMVMQDALLRQANMNGQRQP